MVQVPGMEWAGEAGHSQAHDAEIANADGASPSSPQCRRGRAEAPAMVADPLEYWGRADLRRRRSRALADEVLGQSDALAPEDGALLRAVFLDHKPMTELAALTRMPVRRVRRYVRQLVQRVTSPEFAFVVRQAHAWPLERRRVATAVIVMGKSYRKASIDLGLSLHAVRRHAASIDAMCEASRQLASELAAARLREPACA